MVPKGTCQRRFAGSGEHGMIPRIKEKNKTSFRIVQNVPSGKLT